MIVSLSYKVYHPFQTFHENSQDKPSKEQKSNKPEKTVSFLFGAGN